MVKESFYLFENFLKDKLGNVVQLTCFTVNIHENSSSVTAFFENENKKKVSFIFNGIYELQLSQEFELQDGRRSLILPMELISIDYYENAKKAVIVLEDMEYILTFDKFEIVF